MKKSLYIVLAAATLLMGSCSLFQEPGGSTITQNQYENMEDMVEGTVMGIYPAMYAYGGEHNLFGQRSIDLMTDLLCGDVAMNSQRYGWFVDDERMNTYQSRSYFWTYYYGIIRQCNKGLNVVDKAGYIKYDEDFDLDTITDQQIINSYYMGVLLGMRGWAYAGLQRMFFDQSNKDLSTLSIPLYTEEATINDNIIGAPRATANDVYLRIEEDLKAAINYFDAFEEYVTEPNKLVMDKSVALTTLAYAYLNKEDYDKAKQYANLAITAALEEGHEVLKNAEVLTTGFNNSDHKDWLWGQKTTIETKTSLASFFGQCDIYSYSYASAGDVKGIDENLLKEIQGLGWDKREGWWNNYANSGARNASTYKYAPDGKFYSATSQTLQGDRDWLSDNVFMRMELPYIIKAEAQWQLNELTDAVETLRNITDERVKDGEEATYNDWIATLTTPDAVKTAILYNWRVEFWGEGYGLQTFRRFNELRKLGNNHLRSKKDITPTGQFLRQFTFEIPTSEWYYNPFIRSMEEMVEDN